MAVTLCVCVSDSKIRQRTTAHDIACMCLFGMVGDSMLQVRVCAKFIIGVPSCVARCCDGGAEGQRCLGGGLEGCGGWPRDL